MEYKIDANGRPLGRVASEVATILQGKMNASYNPKDAGTDSVVVSGVKGLVLTGKKTRQKIYYRHSGPLGHLKERKFTDVFARNPAWTLRHAVRLMLPKNKLQAPRLNRLKIVD